MKKALIIDDEKRTRDLIARMVESFDLGIVTYPLGENVQSGIEQINALHPDIVFLDVQMPDGTGFDVLRNVEFKDLALVSFL
jgi:two-component system LytT family response regulator